MQETGCIIWPNAHKGTGGGHPSLVWGASLARSLGRIELTKIKQTKRNPRISAPASPRPDGPWSARPPGGSPVGVMGDQRVSAWPASGRLLEEAGTRTTDDERSAGPIRHTRGTHTTHHRIHSHLRPRDEGRDPGVRRRGRQHQPEPQQRRGRPAGV